MLDRNVFILGAGFSATAGAPLVHDFLDKSRVLLDDPLSPLNAAEREHFQRVFRFRRDVAQAREKVIIDLDDIEQLFGLVEISHRLGKTPRETWDSTVYLIAKTLQLTARADRDRPYLDLQVHRELLESAPPTFRIADLKSFVLQAGVYDYFAALVGGLLDSPERSDIRKNTIITFNYDLVMDDALRRNGIEPNYYIQEDAGFVDAGAGSRRACSVLKLHGSTNWGICSKCQNTVVIQKAKVTESFEEFRNQQCAECSALGFQPLLIPPSWDKSEYRQVMQRVWKKAVEELSSATRICVIGYSMPEVDAFFKYLLSLALSENHSLYKFIVVDIKPELKSTYERLLDPLFQSRRFSFFERGFVHYMVHHETLGQLGRGEWVVGNMHLY